VLFGSRLHFDQVPIRSEGFQQHLQPATLPIQNLHGRPSRHVHRQQGDGNDIIRSERVRRRTTRAAGVEGVERSTRETDLATGKPLDANVPCDAGCVTVDDIISFVNGFEGVLVQRAHSGDGSPEIAWGDTFFYYAPDGVAPDATQPFATIVTKNYPGDETSRLERPGVFRVNVAAGKDSFIAHTGRAPRGTDARVDADAPRPDALDVWIAHPVYGSLAWLAVNSPGPATAAELRRLLEQAHQLARARYLRRK
jgi:hypothetical protein